MLAFCLNYFCYSSEYINFIKINRDKILMITFQTKMKTREVENKRRISKLKGLQKWVNPKYLAQNNLEWLFYSAAVGLITCYALAVYLSLFQISAHLYHSGQAYYLCFPATQKHQSDPVQIPTNCYY